MGPWVEKEDIDMDMSNNGSLLVYGDISDDFRNPMKSVVVMHLPQQR